METTNTTGPEPIWTVNGLLVEGINLVGGGRRAGRRCLAKTLARDIASGRPALGALPVERGAVAYVNPDGEMRTAVEYVRARAGKSACDIYGWHLPMRNSPAGLEPLVDWVRRTASPRLVIFDGWDALRWTSRRDARAALGELAVMCRTQKAAVLAFGEPHDVYGLDWAPSTPNAYLRIYWDPESRDARLEFTCNETDSRVYDLRMESDEHEWRILPPGGGTIPAAKHKLGREAESGVARA
jgi:AAA domain